MTESEVELFYETVFETGRNSVASYDSDEEALNAAREHHRRAVHGERCLLSEPTAPPAERIVKILKYKTHPNDLNVDQTMSEEVLKKELSELVSRLKDENGVVALDQLSVEVRGLAHPIAVEAGPQDSIFKMKETGELSLGSYDKETGKWADN